MGRRPFLYAFSDTRARCVRAHGGPPVRSEHCNHGTGTRYTAKVNPDQRADLEARLAELEQRRRDLVMQSLDDLHVMPERARVCASLRWIREQLTNRG